MHYSLTFLTSELVFIKWHQVSTKDTKPQTDFISELRTILRSADHPVYFLSDLRLGRITDVATLQKLGSLTQHKNYGGGVAFSQDVLSEIFVGVFSKFAALEKGSSVLYDTIDEALAHLETMRPGLVKHFNWKAFLERLDGHTGAASRV